MKYNVHTLLLSLSASIFVYAGQEINVVDQNSAVIATENAHSVVSVEEFKKKFEAHIRLLDADKPAMPICEWMKLFIRFVEDSKQYDNGEFAASIDPLAQTIKNWLTAVTALQAGKVVQTLAQQHAPHFALVKKYLAIEDPVKNVAAQVTMLARFTKMIKDAIEWSKKLCKTA